MKNGQPKLIFAVTFALLIITLTVDAQTEPKGDSKDTRLGIGLSLGYPTNDFFNLATGGDLRFQKDFSSNISGLLSVGYTNFTIKNGAGHGSADYFPLKVGIKVFPIERFYLSGEIGAALGGKKTQGNGFLYAPGIGIGFNNGIDLGLRYENAVGLGDEDTPETKLKLGQIALRIAYGFNLSR